MLRSDLQPPVPRQTRVFAHSVASTAARDYIQSNRPQFLDGGLHLDFVGVLQWYKIVEIQTTQKETRDNPNYTFALHLGIA